MKDLLLKSDLRDLRPAQDFPASLPGPLSLLGKGAGLPGLQGLDPVLRQHDVNAGNRPCLPPPASWILAGPLPAAAASLPLSAHRMPSGISSHHDLTFAQYPTNQQQAPRQAGHLNVSQTKEAERLPADDSEHHNFHVLLQVYMPLR